jgi:hypothetical protein
MSALTLDDATAEAGRPWEYRVTAVDFGGHESAAADVTATRPVPSAPTITLTAPADVNEGSPFLLTLGAVSYSGTGQINQFVVHWGDGATETFTTGGVKSHVFADGTAVRDVVVDLADGQSTYAGAGTVRVTVNDVAPTLVIDGQSAISIGGFEDLTLNSFDPGADTLGDWLIDWGDGTTEPAPAGDAVARHRYDRAGTYTIKATAANEEGSFSSNVITLTVKDMTAPTATPSALPPLGRTGTAAYPFTVTYADDLAMSDAIAADSVRVTGPNGFAADAAVVSVSGSGTSRVVTYAVNPPGGSWDEADNGTYTVALRDGSVADAAGNTIPGRSLGTFTVAVGAAANGSTPDTAIDLGTLPRKSKRSLRESLDGAKPGLYYRVTITEPLKLCTSLGGLKANADLEVWDAAGTTKIASSAAPRKRGEKVGLTALPGTYLIRVTLIDPVATPFKLSVAAKTLSRKVAAALKAQLG